MPIDSTAFDTILGAYIKHQDMQHQQAQLQFEKDTAGQQLKQHQQQIDQIAKQHQDDLDFRSMLAKQQIQAHYNELYGHQDPNAANAAQSNLPTPNPQTSMQLGPNGGPPQAQVSDNVQQQPFQQQPRNLTPQEGYNGAMAKLFPEGIQIDPNYQARQFEVAKRMQDLEARGAGEKAKAVSEAEQPGKETLRRLENEGTAAVESGRAASARDVERMRAGSASDVEVMRAKSAERVANIHGGFQLAAAKIAHSMDIDPDAVSEGIQDVAGGGDITKYPAKLRVAVLAGLKQSGMTVPDSKAVQKSLETSGVVNEFLNQAEDFARTYSRDAPKGSWMGRMKAMLPNTDVNAAQNALAAKAGIASALLEQNNRKSEADIIRERIGNGGDAGATMQSNLANINKARTLLEQYKKSAFHGLPQKQIDYILKKNDLASAPSSPAPQSGNVTLRDGAGKTRTMSREQAQKYLNASKDFSIVQ